MYMSMVVIYVSFVSARDFGSIWAVKMDENAKCHGDRCAKM